MSDGLGSIKTYVETMSKRHIRRSADQWSAIIEQQAKSGLGAKDFCKEKNLGLSTFSKWKRKLQLDGDSKRMPRGHAMPAFQPVEIEPSDPVASSPATRISLTLDDGITMTIERAIPAS